MPHPTEADHAALIAAADAFFQAEDRVKALESQLAEAKVTLAAKDKDVDAAFEPFRDQPDLPNGIHILNPTNHQVLIKDDPRKLGIGRLGTLMDALPKAVA